MTDAAELLPLGSVVLISGYSEKLMILGIFQSDGEDPERVYDYFGVTYPVGFQGINSGKNVLFNHDAVTDVIFYGYEDEQRAQLIEKLAQAQAEASSDQPSES